MVAEHNLVHFLCSKLISYPTTKKAYSPFQVVDVNLLVSNFSGFTSTPMILDAPHNLAPSATFKESSCYNVSHEKRFKRVKILTANPIDPRPKMTTVDPGSTFADLQAAPTPEK